ncbi:MAG: hypothetical protein GWN07_11860, partial [Actinobacteria bacterium]|nr:hypothetical protein [Actinomycetota bacterium]NIX20479.1 hypothetical protein [Actinomycetota bacterium]
DDPLLIVRIFPADPGLPGLAHATDLATLGRLLTTPGDGGTTPSVVTPRYEVLHYKPGRSCGLHYKWSEDDRGVR